MRLAIVVQGYHPEIVGGAEAHAAMLAEKLLKRGHEIDVLTTTSMSSSKWEEVLPAGDEQINGITIKRFKTGSRFPFFWLWERAFRWLSYLSFGLFDRLWLRAQGPYCPDLIKYLDCSVQCYEKIIFFSYLYYPFVYGVLSAKNKAIAIPTVHDEAALTVRMVRRALCCVSVIWANSEAESKLLQQRVGIPKHRIEVMGVGIDGLDPGSQTKHVGRSPYFLYLGRIGKSKGVDILIEFFKSRQDLHLILAGKLDNGFVIPEQKNIEFLGFVDAQKKEELIKNAAALINPSKYESLSLIALEAMQSKTPLIVNRDSNVLKTYADQFESVKAFRSMKDLAICVDWALSTGWAEERHQEQLNISAEWVRNFYAWPSILERMEKNFNCRK